MVPRVRVYAKFIQRSESTTADVASFEQSVAYPTDTKLLNQVYERPMKRFRAIEINHRQNHARAGMRLLLKEIHYEQLCLTKRVKMDVEEVVDVTKLNGV